MQWDPQELEALAVTFMTTVCLIIFGESRDQDNIIKMDQSPIPFDTQRTLELVGAHTVNFHRSTCNTIQATLSVTITESGRILTPVLVLKVCQEVILLNWDFATYLCGCIYAFQSTAWMDEVVMLQWMEQMLKPYIAPLHVVTPLLLDSYGFPIMALVVA